MDMSLLGVPMWMREGEEADPLPLTYHANTKAAGRLVAWLKSEPYRTGLPEVWLVKKEDWELIVRGIGRAYREHQGAMEHEPGTPPPLVNILVWEAYSTSKLEEPHLEALNNVLQGIVDILATYQ